jgi:hypothetical protein
MMIKKQLGVLAAAVVAASSANAAFQVGDAMLYAWNPTNDNTYFVDLGVTGTDLKNSATVDFTDSGLASWLGTNSGAAWTIVGSINDTSAVGGPPAIGPSYVNSGVVSTASTGSSAFTTGAAADTGRNTLNGWMDEIFTASLGDSSFSVLGANPASADSARNGAFFNGAQIAVDSTSSLFYGQADPSDGALLSEAASVSQVGTGGDPQQSAALLGSDGSISANVDASAVPVPAAAWLFGSALAGLVMVRRK